MSIHMARAELLMGQNRFADAQEELVAHLKESPEDAMAFAMISICEQRFDRLKEATTAAEKAIALAPEMAFAHAMLAQTLVLRNRLPEAEAAINEAIRLEPYDASNFGVLSVIHLKRKNFGGALDAADAGLAVDPAHDLCLNQRAQSLLMLGRKAEAAATMAGALANSPEDSLTHANQGFALLHANDPKAAITHFREALRLDPDNEYARAGIVEALKARNIIYRGLLQYFFWVSKLPQQAQWALLATMFFGPGFLRRAAGDSPLAELIVSIIIGIYLLFVAMTWLGNAAFNLLLRFDRDGRYALNLDQIRGANLLVAYLIMPGAMVAGFALTGNKLYQFGALRWALICLPAAAVFSCDKGWPRRVAFALLTGLTLWCIGSTWPAITLPFVEAGLLPVETLVGPGKAEILWLAKNFIAAFIVAELTMLYLIRAEVRS